MWVPVWLCTLLAGGCTPSAPVPEEVPPAATAPEAEGPALGNGTVTELVTLSDNRSVQQRLPENSPLVVGWTLPFKDQKIKSLTLMPLRSKMNAILVLTENHDLIALERNTGKGLWWVRLGGAPLQRPVFSEHTVFVVVDGYLIAIEKQSGNVLWRSRLPFPPAEPMIATEPVLGSPMVAIASLTKVIYGLTVNTTVWPPERGFKTVYPKDITIERKILHVLWTFPIKGFVEGAFDYYDGDLLACDSERKVYALDVTSIHRNRPHLKWSSLTRGPNTAGMVINGGYAFTASRDRNIYCYLRRDGGELWRNETGFRLVDLPQVVKDPGTLKPFVFQNCSEGPLLCLTANEGKLIWQDDQGGYVALVSEDKDRKQQERGAVAIVHPDESITCRQILDGREMWTLPPAFLKSIAGNVIDQQVYGVIDEGQTLCMLKRR